MTADPTQESKQVEDDEETESEEDVLADLDEEERKEEPVAKKCDGVLIFLFPLFQIHGCSNLSNIQRALHDQRISGLCKRNIILDGEFFQLWLDSSS